MRIQEGKERSTEGRQKQRGSSSSRKEGILVALSHFHSKDVHASFVFPNVCVRLLRVCVRDSLSMFPSLVPEAYAETE